MGTSPLPTPDAARKSRSSSNNNKDKDNGRQLKRSGSEQKVATIVEESKPADTASGKKGSKRTENAEAAVTAAAAAPATALEAGIGEEGHKKDEGSAKDQKKSSLVEGSGR